MYQRQKQLLILDLDETLVFASKEPLAREADFRVAHYHLYRRPGLDAFLEFASIHFRLAVWTSASPRYAQAVCKTLFADALALEFVWSRDHCMPSQDGATGIRWLTKPFRKLGAFGYDLKNVLVIDDSPEKHVHNHGNLIRINPFYGDPNDNELRCIVPYLKMMRVEPDVRRVEKRGWKMSLAFAGA